MPSGSGTGGRTDAGRQRIGRTEPGVPMATTTWSMIPHGAPTTWFSASWHSDGEPERVEPRRRRAPVRSRPPARRSTTRRPTAGTSDDTDEPRARRFDHAVAHEHERDADDVVRPARERRGRVADLGIRELRQRRHLVGGRAAPGPPTSASPGSATTVVVSRVGDLEHERARVVGDATEQVEAAGRATA